jgi:hypothetical protein
MTLGVEIMKLMYILAGALVALMLLVAMPVAAASVEPVLYEKYSAKPGEDNPDIPNIVTGDAKYECDQVNDPDCDFAYKWNEDPDGEDGPPLGYPAEGAPNGEITTEDGNTFTISNSDGKTFDWASDYPVCSVMVKAGTAYYVYFYGGATSDTGLVAPDSKDISHISFCYNDPDTCYEEETAWAVGTNYVRKPSAISGGNWAMFVEYAKGPIYQLRADGGDGVGTIIGTATFSAPYDAQYPVIKKGKIVGTDTKPSVDILIELTNGAKFYYDVNDPVYDNNLKVQDYATAPSKNPSPGLFTYKVNIPEGSTTGTITVPVNIFYGIHLDVALPVPCE